MTETKLSSAQESLLKSAAASMDRAIRWPVNLRGGARVKIITALVAAGLAENQSGSLVITAAGMRAVGTEPDATAGTGDTGATKPASGKKATGAKPGRQKAAAARKKPAGGKSPRTGAPRAARTNSKQAQLIEMLKRAKGASIDEIVEAFGWQPHTVRGAIAGALKKKLGLDVTSEKDDKRGRVYKIAA